MAGNIPLPPDMATSRKIALRIEQALDSALQTIRFAHADLDDRELQREASWAALRWGYRVQDALAGIGEPEPEAPLLVPMPEEDGEPDAAWPASTPTNGTEEQ